ncbi:hypothetical protein [Geochorda subterranea]|uniref:DUF5723 domain-containing protein n=1 Tax=Geochorda subterranea TaxID=3109564 RepID=A0ABZ1BPZ1_9FIRM|nr:hypothetical protein [Limnochorda sp. LNt]WRP14774.1 hypothetical protein VLY81_00980 [Limnochorda sp. LNt]
MGLGRRTGRTLAMLAALALVGSTGAWAAETSVTWSPYLMVSDPIAANPAAFPWRVVAVSVGPLAAELESSDWTLAEASQFFQALASDGGSSPAADQDQHLRLAARGRAMVSVAALQAGWGLSVAGSGSLSEETLTLLREGDQADPSRSYSLEGTALTLAAWQDAFVRVNAPVPFIPRLLGIEGFSAGAGYHWLSGLAYVTVEGEGTLNAAQEDPEASLTIRRSRQGNGSAFEVGAVARINRLVSLEGAYLGGGHISWSGLEETLLSKETVESNPSDPWQTRPVGGVDVLRLPDVALVGVHVRPLASGLLELSGYFSRIGIGSAAPVDRLQAEASFDALGLLRATLGAARDSALGPAAGEPWRLYASLGVGLGGSGLTIRAVNLQEIGKGAAARSLGLSVMASLGL